MQVEAKVVVIEANDVADAISKEVARCSISKLIIGASSGNPFIRYGVSLVYSKLCMYICCWIMFTFTFRKF